MKNHGVGDHGCCVLWEKKENGLRQMKLSRVYIILLEFSNLIQQLLMHGAMIEAINMKIELSYCERV